jgi:hypothetical protein
MEELMHFVESTSLYIFKGTVLTPLLRDMWSDLRAAVLHYCRPRHGELFTTATRDEAREAMLSYARAVEQHFPWSLLSYNIHLAACRCVGSLGFELAGC